MFSDFMEGKTLFKELVLDKVSFRVHHDRINTDAITGLRGKGPINITETGGYFDINIHGEGLLPWESVLTQCAWYFKLLACLQVFDFHTNLAFLLFFGDHHDLDKPENCALFISLLEIAGISWVQFEIAYDFSDSTCPVRTPEGVIFKKYRGTIYSGDCKRNYRIIEKDGSEYRESKGNRKSTICVYNRGKKIGSSTTIYRLEIRLQKHHLGNMFLGELAVPFFHWVYMRHEFLSKRLRLAKTKGWSIRNASIKPQHFMLHRILEKGGWEVL